MTNKNRTKVGGRRSDWLNREKEVTKEVKTKGGKKIQRKGKIEIHNEQEVIKPGRGKKRTRSGDN